jgi:hypothetical protein
MKIWHLHIACWIPKATNTHSQYVIITDFPLQQWLRERAVVLRYTYIACLVSNTFIMTPGKGKLEMYLSCCVWNILYTDIGYCIMHYVKHLSVFVCLLICVCVQRSQYVHDVEWTNPITGLDRPSGLQEVEAPRFQDNRHVEVVRISPTHRPPLPPGDNPGTHFC